MAILTTRYLGDMLFESQLGNHTLRIDVPAAMGGSDRAPTPPELFVASLGSCVAAFAASYCERSGIDATDMSVDVMFEKAANSTRLTNLRVVINLPHGHCAAREEALRKVAEHCPVHETILTLEELEFEIHDAETLVAPV